MMADPIAQERWVEVRGISPPGKPDLLTVGGRGAARYGKKRSDDAQAPVSPGSAVTPRQTKAGRGEGLASGDPSEAGGAAASQEIHQRRLSVVITRVAGRRAPGGVLRDLDC